MAEMVSNGLTLGVWDDVSAYDLLGGITSISGFGGGTASIIDVTDLSDTYKQKLSGQLDGGEVSISLNADTANTTQEALKTDFTNSTQKQYQITLTDSGPSTITFDAVISSLTYSATTDDKITLEVSLAIVGGYTWA